MLNLGTYDLFLNFDNIAASSLSKWDRIFTKCSKTYFLLKVSEGSDFNRSEKDDKVLASFILLILVIRQSGALISKLKSSFDS